MIKITCSFDEMCYIKNNLYKFINKEITYLNNFCDKYFKQLKEWTSQRIFKIYFIDTETDTNEEYNKVFCIFYTETDEIDKQFNLIKENNKSIDGVEFIFFGNIV